MKALPQSIFSIALLACFALASCGKGEKTTATQGNLSNDLASSAVEKTQPAEPAAAPISPQPSEAAPRAVPRNYVVNGQVDLEALNKTLRDYVRWKKVIPRDLSELVTSGYLSSLPAAPAGKRFVIALHPLGYAVVLEDQ